MEWVFGDFALNTDRVELSGPDGVVRVEKQPLDLLIFLARHADRVVTRDELVEHVWNGRIVSDTTISTAVKQARRAVGDTGAAQAVIRTVHGRGFRFVADITARSEPARASAPETVPPVGTARPSIAVLRFQLLGADPRGPTIADAIPAELITSLSRLHWLHIIARASSFRFDPHTCDPGDLGARLGVRYALTGSVETEAETLAIRLELLSTADGALLWSDRYAARLQDAQGARREIVASIIQVLELVVPRFEAERTRDLAPAEFDAWSHYHLGLRHMFRFNAADNEVAARHFHAAVALDPDFCRAHGGVSFIHWQSAFMNFGEDRRLLLEKASHAAGEALRIDPEDPFANFNMGRAMWLTGDLDAGLDWMDRALTTNPNHAQSHYAKGLALLMSGDAAAAEVSADEAMSLSPLDPLHYAMLTTKAMSHIARGNFETACRLTSRAVNSPGAHFYIGMIAAAAHSLGGDASRAQALAARTRTLEPNASVPMFLEAFPFADRALKSTLADAMQRVGF